jgi:hypothetical protein
MSLRLLIFIMLTNFMNIKFINLPILFKFMNSINILIIKLIKLIFLKAIIIIIN